MLRDSTLIDRSLNLTSSYFDNGNYSGTAYLSSACSLEVVILFYVENASSQGISL